jgi:hypothetical protein
LPQNPDWGLANREHLDALMLVQFQLGRYVCQIEFHSGHQAEVKTDITAYIVEFYSCNRIHSILGNLSPSVFGRNKAAKNPIVVSEIT